MPAEIIGHAVPPSYRKTITVEISGERERVEFSTIVIVQQIRNLFDSIRLLQEVNSKRIPGEKPLLLEVHTL